MSTLTIGQAAKHVGCRPSTLRYYESTGLLPPAPRVGGRRVYNAQLLARATLVRQARQLGFSIREIARLTDGFPATTPLSERWRVLASEKLEALDAAGRALARQKRRVRRLFDCACGDLDECARLAAAS